MSKLTKEDKQVIVITVIALASIFILEYMKWN